MWTLQELFRSPKQRQKMPQNVHKPFTTTQNSWEIWDSLRIPERQKKTLETSRIIQNPREHLTWNQNVKESLWTFRNLTEQLKIHDRTLEYQRTFQNLLEPFKTNDKYTKDLRTYWNVRERFRTFSNHFNLLRSHINASEHPRRSEQCLKPL